MGEKKEKHPIYRLLLCALLVLLALGVVLLALGVRVGNSPFILPTRTA